MIRLAYPYFALFVLVILPMIAAAVYHYRTRKARLSRFADPAMSDRLLTTLHVRKTRWKSFLSFMIAIALVLALVGFEVGTKYEQVKISGVDIVIALDVSTSMNAEDIKPSRLEKAKHEISSFLEQLGGDRVALVLFAGQGFIQCPLTTDYSAIQMFLDAVTTSTTTSAGTDFAEALDVVAQVYSVKTGSDQTSVAGKAAVIFSDGEDHNPDSFGIIERFKQENIKVFAVGVGSPNASPIPIYDESGNLKDFKKSNGSVVTTRLEEAFMEKLTSETGGAYYTASTGELEVKRIYQEISKLEKTENSDYQFTEFENRFQWFLAIAIAALVADLIIHSRQTVKA